MAEEKVLTLADVWRLVEAEREKRRALEDQLQAERAERRKLEGRLAVFEAELRRLGSRTWLISESLWRRVLGVLGHVALGYALLGVGAVVVSWIMGLALGS